MPDPLALLRRTDKHYLSAADGVLFDPPLPLWLDRPGFWDGGRVYLYTLQPIFAVTLVDGSGGERALSLVERTWTPAEIVARYRSGELVLEERRVVVPGGVFASEWRVRNEGPSPIRLHAVAWTAQEGRDLPDRDAIGWEGPVAAPGGDAPADGGRDAPLGGLRFLRRAADAQGRSEGLDLDCVLGIRAADPAPAGGTGDATWAAYESQHARAYPNPPWWDIAPFRERWSERGLADEAELAGASPEMGRTLLYLAAAVPLALEPGEAARFTATLRAVPADAALRPPSAGRSLPASPAQESRDAWSAFFADAPALHCSDPYFDRWFAYRWYGLRLNFIEPSGNYRWPTVAEGIEYFHCPIAYSAWCHARELRWLADPGRARGVIRTFLSHQREDGSLPGRVYLDHMRRTDFYFADWGGSVEAVDEVHPDDGFLEEVYAPLSRYADWLDRERDPERTGAYDVLDPYETGQENTSRYTAVDPEGDRGHFEYRIRLKGVDLTIYAYRLRRALGRTAARLGRPADVEAHDAVAARIAHAVRARMWDPERELFSDLHPETLRPTGVRAAVCFYPYMTDLVGEEHLGGLHRHLFDAGAFWLPYPVPSTAADDPGFSADARWRGVRQSCTWNGRVWPMTNAHVAEALGCVATRLDPSLRSRTSELLRTWIQMMTFEGDPARPNCFEHYSPLTGRAAVYRGLDDYQHSWVNDLLIRYVAGLRPSGERHVVVDPFPFGLDRLRLERVPVRGAEISVALEGEVVEVRVNGARAGAGVVGEPVVVEI